MSMVRDYSFNYVCKSFSVLYPTEENKLLIKSIPAENENDFIYNLTY